MTGTHTFSVELHWTGNLGLGTADYRAYSRNHEIGGAAKAAAILGSSDPAFRGDGSRYNPEELLVASLSACHMLWVLHLCADAGIAILDYSDAPSGTMQTEPDGGGRFTEAVLRPRVTVAEAARVEEARQIHHRAHELCFISRSVNFPVRVEPEIVAEERGAGA